MINVKKIRELFHATALHEKVYAPLIGMSLQNFSNCLHQRRKFTTANLEQIARYHGCTVEDLMISPSLEQLIDENKKYEIGPELRQQLERMILVVEYLRLEQHKEIRETVCKLRNLLLFADLGLPDNNFLS